MLFFCANSKAISLHLFGVRLCTPSASRGCFLQAPPLTPQTRSSWLQPFLCSPRFLSFFFCLLHVALQGGPADLSFFCHCSDRFPTLHFNERFLQLLIGYWTPVRFTSIVPWHDRFPVVFDNSTSCEELHTHTHTHTHTNTNTHTWPWTIKPVIRVNFLKLRFIHHLKAE